MAIRWPPHLPFVTSGHRGLRRGQCAGQSDAKSVCCSLLQPTMRKMQAVHCRNVGLTRRAPRAFSRAVRIGRPCITPSQRFARKPIAAAASDEVTEPFITLDKPEFIEVDTSFSLSKISFGKILAPIGVTFMLYGFAAYVTLVPGGDFSSILLVYGFPISLLGFALTYAQLIPVPCLTDKRAFELRGKQMTDNQRQVREDCTRFRYGDEQHLEEALDKIFKYNKPQGIPRRNAPVLVGLREQIANGNFYTLVLEFESTLDFDKWEQRRDKFESFFGPGIVAEMQKTARGVDVLLASDGSGLGIGGTVQKDALPPLMPGMKARQQ